VKVHCSDSVWIVSFFVVVISTCSNIGLDLGDDLHGSADCSHACLSFQGEDANRLVDPE
jgi:hypothetical protein